MEKSHFIEDDMKINSRKLQKNFHSIYKDFFHAHDIVLSGNNILTWGSDIPSGENVLKIKQKISTKTFCGAIFNNSGKITFRKTSGYSILENTFKKDVLYVFSDQEIGRITGFLHDFLVKNDFTLGVEIKFLFESSPGHGFSFSSVVSVLLTTLLYIITGKLDPETLSDGKLPLEHPLFDELYQLSLNLLSCIGKSRNINGSNNYAVMIPDHSLPIVYFSKRNTNYKNSECMIPDNQNTKTLFPADIDVDIYKNTLTHFLGIENSIPPIEKLPLDYGVIFTGSEYRFSEDEKSETGQENKEYQFNSFITDIIQSLPIKDVNKASLSHLLCFEKNELICKKKDNMNLKILDGFNRILKNTQDNNAMNLFFDAIKNAGMLSFFSQKENRLFFAFQYLFYKYRQFEDEEIGIVPFNAEKIGNNFFFVMKSGKSYVTLQKVLNHLQNEGYTISINYASWRDGCSSDGVCIEQFITRGLYSEYTKEGSVLFIDSFGTSYCGDYDAMVEDNKDCILLDTIRRRIYIGGKQLTSKEIHSQNTTIDMLKVLIENMGKEIPNSKLPVSTYSQNKNEILGKVILPLKKLTEKYYGKEISLFCSGGTTDYFLRLERDESIRIGIIKKLQE